MNTRHLSPSWTTTTKPTILLLLTICFISLSSSCLAAASSFSVKPLSARQAQAEAKAKALTIVGSAQNYLELTTDLISAFSTDYEEFRTFSDDQVHLVDFSESVSQVALDYLNNETSGGTTGVRDFFIAAGVDIALQKKIMPDFHAVPFAAFAVVVVANIPGLIQPPLVLSLETLALIFTACNQTMCIERWDDPRILAINAAANYPALTAAGRIARIVPSISARNTQTFQRALLETDAISLKGALTNQLGNKSSTSATWRGVMDITRLQPGFVTTARLQTQVGAMSYMNIDTANVAGFETVALKVPGTAGNIVTASVESTQVAVFAAGLADKEFSYTVEIEPGIDSHRWPMVQYAFFIYRGDALRTKATCKHRMLLLDFATFILKSSVAETVLGWYQVSRPPPIVVDAVMTVLQQTIKCNGVPVYTDVFPDIDVRIQGVEGIYNTLKLLDAVQSQKFSHSFSSYHQLSTHLVIANELLAPGTPYGKIILADEPLVLDLDRDAEFLNFNYAKIPFAVMGYGFVYQWCNVNVNQPCAYDQSASAVPLTLTLEVATAMLDGDIANWTHPAIVALNPTLSLPNIPIHVVQGPTDARDSFMLLSRLKNCCKTNFDFKAAEIQARTFASVRGVVKQTVGGFAFVPFNVSNALFGLPRANLKSAGGLSVPPLPENLEACATDTYEDSTGFFDLSKSLNPNCYPLSTSIYVVSVRNYPNTSLSCPLGVATDVIANGIASEVAYLIDFYYSGSKVEEALRQEEFGSLQTLITVNRHTGADVDMTLVTRELVDSITCGSQSVVAVKQNLNLIPDALVYSFYALVVFCLTVNAGLVVWVIVNRNRKIIKNSSPAFMLQVLLGASIQLCTVFALAQQDHWLSTNAVPVKSLNNPISEFLNNACIAGPILFSLGFFITYSALFLKAWRLIKIFNNTKLRHLYIKDVQLLFYQLFVLLVVVGLNLIWVLQDPLIWHRMSIHINERNLLVTESVGICYSPGGIGPAVPLLVGVLLVLVFGNYLAWLGRKIPTEFNESKWTAMAMVVFLQCMLLGIPVLALSNNQPVAGFVVKAIICIVTAAAVVSLIFFPKVALANGWFAAETSDVWRNAEGSSSSKKQEGSIFIAGNNGGVESPASSNNTRSKADKSSIFHVNSVGGLAGQNNNSKDSTKVGDTSSRKMPSLASLVDTSGFQFHTPDWRGRTTTSSTTPSPHGAVGTITTKGEALTQVLTEDPLKRRFRRFLIAQKADENLKFWDAVEAFRREPVAKRGASARSIVNYFIVDSAPKQINLKAPTRAKLLEALKKNDLAVMGQATFFDQAMTECFDDLKQSDAFQQYLESGGSTSMDVSGGGAPTSGLNVKGDRSTDLSLS